MNFDSFLDIIIKGYEMGNYLFADRIAVCKMTAVSLVFEAGYPPADSIGNMIEGNFYFFGADFS